MPTQQTTQKKKKKSRKYMGKGIIQFPNNFTVIDIETTGFSPDWYSVMEVSAIKYIGNHEVDRFSSLVRPDRKKHGKYLCKRREELCGITNEMLETAPRANKILPRFIDFLSDDILLGYSVDFDVRFLYDVFLRDYQFFLSNNYVDIHPFALKLLPDLESYSLCSVAEFYGIQDDNAHRAENDCFVTFQCYQRLREDAKEQYGDVNEFIQILNKN